MSSIFSSVPTAPPDAILGLTAQFRADPDPRKVNLGVGAFRTSSNKPYVLPVVRRVEQQLADDPSATHEYLPQDGLQSFCDASARLILGADSPALADGRVTTVQALSGTGALRVGFAFVANFISSSTSVYVPKQTWSNHRNVIPAAGLPRALEYRYLDPRTGAVDIAALVEDLDKAPAGSIILLHGCAHNPTGADPTQPQWLQILDVVKRRKLVPFFDNAYQGFASGSLETDAWSVRTFVAAGLDMLVAQSYAKNMGMYGERVGALSVVASSAGAEDAVRSQLKATIRAMYSSPPKHGAMVAAAILGDEKLFAEWEGELVKMSARIMDMRVKLKAALEKNATPGNWDRITSQIGMFSYTGLTSQQVTFMREKYHVYMTANGRISMAGLTDDTVQYVADAMKDAVESVVKQD
ncbi:aspartate aminotransferase [Chondrus crispus]|uniref:Aspartate aminotransferase n=1 Tax=Chondrus crispus TaxID=2769 RepID=R7QBK1_CHOCR|nr:aspartate aminotransferase [Chondrus crispus]CDF35434.1 aspartate aminotransferase [Chondrus crispus]|eukprot:XP_005715253.1 aspartate aminotransferase [Chondrus crispus]